jgi:hypothetical protein
MRPLRYSLVAADTAIDTAFQASLDLETGVMLRPLGLSYGALIFCTYILRLSVPPGRLSALTGLTSAVATISIYSYYVSFRLSSLPSYFGLLSRAYAAPFLLTPSPFLCVRVPQFCSD